MYRTVLVLANLDGTVATEPMDDGFSTIGDAIKSLVETGWEDDTDGLLRTAYLVIDSKHHVVATARYVDAVGEEYAVLISTLADRSDIHRRSDSATYRRLDAELAADPHLLDAALADD